MTYEQLVKKIRTAAGKADVSAIREHLAYQFNVTGEAEGIFYLEVADGEVRVEPYEYYDRDVIITGTADTIVKIMNGKLDPVMAYMLHMIKVEGNLEKALLLKEMIH